MRFTPPQDSCTVKSAKIAVYNKTSSATCSLFVWDNNGGLPATAPKIQTTYTAIVTSGNWEWQTVDLPSEVSYNTDFWMGIWLPDNGGAPNGTALLTDSVVNYPDRTAGNSLGMWQLWSASGDWRIRAIVSTTSIEDAELLPIGIALKQNFPNPVVDKTTISYIIPQTMKVRLEIYDITGRNIRTLVNEVQSAGAKEIVWDKKNVGGEPVSPGMYFYILNTTSTSLTKTLVVL